MTYFSQMAGLTVQNYASAAVGIVVAVALIRGIAKRVTDHDAPGANSVGNFWQDLVRTILYILLPISFVVAIVLIWQGSIQNFSHYLSFTGITHLAQTIAMGPVASQEAIKLLGTNGGGFFNTNSAHPFENPTAFTNFVEMLVVLMIPAALGLHLRPHGRQPPPGLRDLRNDDGDVPGRGDRLLHRRGARLARTARGRAAHGCDRRLRRRQPRGQGAALRHRRLGAVRRGHDGHLVRRGEQRDRILHRDRRRGSVREPERQRGDLRRRRHRALLDPAVRPAGGLPRRPDGRPHARVHRQEDRGQGDQAGRARDLDNAVGGAVLNSVGDGVERRPSVDRHGRGQRAAGLQ